MIYTQITDTHCFGPNEIMSAERVLDLVIKSQNPVLTGDIFDFINCDKRDIGRMLEQAWTLNKYVKKAGGQWLAGNHEGSAAFKLGLPLYWFDCREEKKVTLFLHGHTAMWDRDRVTKWEQKELGASWFKRKFLSRAIDSLRHFKDDEPNKRFKQFLAYEKSQSLYLTNVICGHSHPKNDVFIDFLGINATISKRGVHERIVD